LGFCTNGSKDFQTSERGRFDLQEFFSIYFFQALDVAERGLLCFIQVFDDGAGRRNEVIGAVIDAEAFEGSGAEVL
jgi:hypothetical protein